MKNLKEKTVIAAAAVAIIYLVLFLFVDRAVDLWVHNSCSDTWVPAVGKAISELATGSYVRLGIAVCFILIVLGDPGLKRRGTRSFLYVCVCGAIAITIGDGIKYLLARYRPVMLFEHDLYGLHFLSSEWALNSTPSGHTIRAFTVFTALSMLYRRFTTVFISLAILIGVSRVAVTAHYPSDVLFGAFIGIFTSLWTYRYFYGMNCESAGGLSH